MSNIVLGGVPVELASDIGRQFVVDCTRAGEGLISDRELAEIYEISPADWQNIAKDAALGRAIRAERDRRVRSGVAAREAAAKTFCQRGKGYWTGSCRTSKRTSAIGLPPSPKLARRQHQKVRTIHHNPIYFTS